MVFIKKVTSGDKTYYYLTQSYRVGDTVRQKTIKRLSAEEAEDPDIVAKFLKENPEYKQKDVTAIILAAGKAKRLYPYVQDEPKALIPIAGAPILDHILSSLTSHGIYDIHLITGFQAHKFHNKYQKRLNLIYNPFYDVSGILASLWFGLQRAEGPLVILYGDLLYDSTIIAELLAAKKEFTIAMTTNMILNRNSEKVIVEANQVTEIGKHLSERMSTGEFAGILKATEKGSQILIDTVNQMAKEGGFLEASLTDLFERLIVKGHKIGICKMKAQQWADIDSPKDLQRAEQTVYPNLREQLD